jgi:hypothetical protein
MLVPLPIRSDLGFSSWFGNVGAQPNSRLGHRRLDLTDEPVLFWPVRGQYMVIYLSDTEPLKIVRILQGARNASAQL